MPPFVGFPLVAVDWPVALRDERHRRAFDRVAETVVVEVPALQLEHDAGPARG
ncbi:MAG TPA: hypothetical protein VGS09_01605 [Actinomycetota bacterium]|nr:hypothetical protein [Actinomycetota bacterium]